MLKHVQARWKQKGRKPVIRRSPLLQLPQLRLEPVWASLRRSSSYLRSGVRFQTTAPSVLLPTSFSLLNQKLIFTEKKQTNLDVRIGDLLFFLKAGLKSYHSILLRPSYTHFPVRTHAVPESDASAASPTPPPPVIIFFRRSFSSFSSRMSLSVALSLTTAVVLICFALSAEEKKKRK